MVVMELGRGQLRPAALWEMCLSVITGMHIKPSGLKNIFVHATQI